MSEQIDNLVDDLVEAINEEDADRARDLINKLGDQYDEQSVEEQKQIRQATLLRGDSELGDGQKEKLEGLVSTSASTEMKRGAFLIRAVSAVLQIEQDSTPDESFDQAVSEVKTADNNLEDQKQNAESVIGESNIPPSVEVVRFKLESSTSRVDDSTPVEAIVANIGDEPAEDIEVTLDAGSEIQVSKLGELPSSIEGGRQEQLLYEVKGTKTGEYQIRFEATSGNGGSDIDSVTLTLEEEQESSVEDYAAEDGIVKLSGLRDAIEDWRTSEISDTLLSEVTAAWRSREGIA